jgi:hypothetical protein
VRKAPDLGDEFLHAYAIFAAHEAASTSEFREVVDHVRHVNRLLPRVQITEALYYL